MEQLHLKHTYRFRIDAGHGSTQAAEIKRILGIQLADAPGGQKIEVNLGTRTLTLRSSEPLDLAALKQALQSHGYPLQEITEQESRTMQVCVDGMTCHSCELIIERTWKKIPGVTGVEVQASRGKAKITCEGTVPTIEELQRALGEGKYIVSTHGVGGSTTKTPMLQLIGLFALVLLFGKILSSVGLLQPNVTIGEGMSFGAIFLLGLVAASSSCIAVSGGLLLSSAATFNARFGSASSSARMRPVMLFVLGRLIGYTLLGGLLGLIGRALTPSPLVTAGITLLAAFYMLVMGLEMLQIAPAWLKRFTPKMPKALSNRVMDAEGNAHPLAPLALGAATFFLPCGFTQALQLYALTTGSFLTAALSLGSFALGTIPALIALGWASSSLKGKVGQFFFKFSGALVVVLGLWNIQNGLAVAGYPLSFPAFAKSTSVAASAGDAAGAVPIVDGVQVIKMKASGGYQPNHFTIRAGTPVRWEVDATDGGGCLSVLVSRPLGIQKLLAQDASNMIEFTPTITGEIPFSCSMGMYRGSFTILPAV